MASVRSTNSGRRFGLHALAVLLGIGFVIGAAYFFLPAVTSVSYTVGEASSTPATVKPKPKVVLDKQDYDRRLLALAKVATSSPWYAAFLNNTKASTTEAKPLWPIRTAYPKEGAILPFKRIVAYYGNFYSTKMGILGEYEKAEVLSRLRAEVAAWEAADPTTPVVPAIEYIDVTAQGAPGKDGKYRLRMPDTQVDKAIEYAKEINGIVILDIQVGLSSVQEEVPLLDKYWAMPQVHLAIDPEFDMQGTNKPGDVIGTTDAATINWAIEYLAKFVREHDLPPKILLLHRFTQKMITDYQDIKPLPEVQVIMQMDGWGSPARKKNTYYQVVEPEPVQFTGIKLFYKNDLKEEPPRLLTKEEVLKLNPAPVFIQYQ
ncbi:MAG: hypothetical protein JWL87_250 [Candidatus Adlerbacteria bacterium]|nr:hypothetical protein [Candidatus Adlerbacteria bacterium]